jgi:DNA mismatch repair protein MutS
LAKQETDIKHTPLMAQYYSMKAKHPDAILLFRVGDFYETFGQDAVKASQALGITLTNRNNGSSDTELAGFPYHALDVYLPKLIKAGYRVAVCEQLEKPSKEKKIVDRGITELVTPGTALDDKLLDHKRNNFLCALDLGKPGDKHGIAFVDLSTGEFLVGEGSDAFIDKLLQSFQPSEVIFSKSMRKYFGEKYGESFYTYCLDEWIFSTEFTQERLLEHFQVLSMKGFGIEEMERAQVAAGVILYYLNTTENTQLQHINHISRIHSEEFVWLDRFTIRNLELIYSPHETGRPLIDVLDRTVNPMGARMLKKWLLLPLTDPIEIMARQSVVSFFVDQKEHIYILDPLIKSIGDIERLMGKVPSGKINPREAQQLGKSLVALQGLKKHLLQLGIPELKRFGDSVHPCDQLLSSVQGQLMPDPPLQVSKGNVIAYGVSEELDEWRDLISNSKDKLAAIQQKEATATGITSLKIGFNNVFGYYLEVTNKYKDQNLIPDSWIRKQTLANAERYITDELKHLETRILSAEEKIQALEETLFNQLVRQIAEYIQPIQFNAKIIAKIDTLLSFAKLAIDRNYCAPVIDDGLQIDIHEGRHPVIEDSLPPGVSYVPNDVYLNNEDQQILLITGPNMAGKSALLRQTALICLLAQMGSYVPAKSARLGIIDKIFTRVGASDNISSGESTFMVEMNETASIMNNLSERSLILLDEIGRGTSTYDGISIAWALAEFLHTNSFANPKTLFATHYHEMNELAEKFPRIKNFSISTKEVGQKIIFLRKLIPGGSQHSFGIHVARMAGMPKVIVDRANEILTQLEQKFIEDNKTAVKGRTRKALQSMPQSSYQLSIFQTQDPQAELVAKKLKELNINEMTPIDCFLKIQELQKLLYEQ